MENVVICLSQNNLHILNPVVHFLLLLPSFKLRLLTRSTPGRPKVRVVKSWNHTIQSHTCPKESRFFPSAAVADIYPVWYSSTCCRFVRGEEI
jgi:hypothetical protein